MEDKKKIVIQPKKDQPAPPPDLPANTTIAIKPKNQAPPTEGSSDKPAPARTSGKRKLFRPLSIVLLVLLSAVVYFIQAEDDSPTEDKSVSTPDNYKESSPNESGWGYFLNDTLYNIMPGIVPQKTSIVQTLKQLNVNSVIIQKLYQQRPEIDEPIEQEAKFKLLSEKTDKRQPAYFVYEPTPEWCTIISLKPDSLYITRIKRQITIKPRQVWLIISSEGLIQDVLDRRLPYEIIGEIEKAFTWTIDLFHLKPGDQLKICFEEKYLGEECVGIGKVYALELNSQNTRYQAFNFPGKRGYDYFNEKAQTLKRSFLMSPLQIGRMSSAFSLMRKHPVTGVVKAHKGTDYAAPEGTEIQSVSNGSVERMGEDAFNGRFIKIKHDAVYSSQYLHLSEFVKGMKIGDPVRQGQTIGYVGHTGQATGPHVCFRFWKNNEQVDHTKESFPAGNSISSYYLESFVSYRDSLSKILKDFHDY